MNNATKSILFVLLTLTVATTPAVQASEQRSQDVDYGDGVKMTQLDDKAGFIMTVKNGPTFKFDSRTQCVLMKNPDGSSKLVSLNY
jgi:hypothetical protein